VVCSQRLLFPGLFVNSFELFLGVNFDRRLHAIAWLFIRGHGRRSSLCHAASAMGQVSRWTKANWNWIVVCYQNAQLRWDFQG